MRNCSTDTRSTALNDFQFLTYTIIKHTFTHIYFPKHTYWFRDRIGEKLSVTKRS